MPRTLYHNKAFTPFRAVQQRKLPTENGHRPALQTTTMYSQSNCVKENCMNFKFLKNQNLWFLTKFVLSTFQDENNALSAPVIGSLFSIYGDKRNDIDQHQGQRIQNMHAIIFHHASCTSIYFLSFFSKMTDQYQSFIIELDLECSCLKTTLRDTRNRGR